MAFHFNQGFEVFFFRRLLNKSSLGKRNLLKQDISKTLLVTMEVNPEEGAIKYSKLIEQNVEKDKEPSLILSQKTIAGMGQEISCLDFLTYSWQEMAFLSCLVLKSKNWKILSCLDFVNLFLTLSCLENFENWKFLSCLDLVNLVLTHWTNYHFIEISAFFSVRWYKMHKLILNEQFWSNWSTFRAKISEK